jgi:hypothetical protein
MPWSHQTFHPILTMKLLEIMFRNRCWSTTFSHYNNWRSQWMVPESVGVINPSTSWSITNGQFFPIHWFGGGGDHLSICTSAPHPMTPMSKCNNTFYCFFCSFSCISPSWLITWVYLHYKHMSVGYLVLSYVSSKLGKSIKMLDLHW